MKSLESKKYWIWFSKIEGLGVKRKQQLLKVYHNPERIYNLKREELRKVYGIGEKIIDNIFKSKNDSNLKKDICYMKQNEIDIISIQEEQYPRLLKEIYDPPISLYVKGNKEILNQKSIAIIGCREATDYGKKAANYFSYNLSKEKGKFVIISGLAKGIDSCAHIGCLKAKGRTIAVVGNGLDMIYPKENELLAKEIIKEGGAIISEYPLGAKPKKMNFPARNRIVSGISRGVIVIEAKEKSGTLITVDFALEQGRDVFVVPGNINSNNSVGTNKLIKQGANLVMSYKDVISEMR